MITKLLLLENYFACVKLAESLEERFRLQPKVKNREGSSDDLLKYC